MITRKSSCVNARGIPPAVYWVLFLLSYLGTPPPPLAGGGVPEQGTPQAGYPPSWPGWGGTWPGYPPPPGRVPPGQGTPHPDLAGEGGYLTRVPPPPRVPPGRVPPPQLDLAGYPPAGPGRIPPPPQCLPHGILGNVAKHYGIWVPPPPPVDRQMEGQAHVKTLPFRRTTYAGGNKRIVIVRQPPSSIPRYIDLSGPSWLVLPEGGDLPPGTILPVWSFLVKPPPWTYR